MPHLSRDARLATWIAEEQAVRSRLAAPGTLTLAEVAAMAPMDFFDGIGRGDLPSPPINAVLDFTPVHWASGLFVFQGTPDQRHYNPLGSVHGGYIATLLDSCMGCAVHTLLKPGQAYTTTDLRVSYIRALRSEAGPVRAEGRIIHVGRSTALAEGRLYDVEERLYAVASTTCLILDMNAARQNSDAGVR
jgi:uncharacterized protein (TIGR00369 family)